ncbi:subunit alpha of organic solute transporter [Chloropicon primus]|uniref:Subunit alpha of organic solute transporter n=1 Tax=Chloropicon primus TaxID=1764295 RepID=A0A5B8MP89_9CHLO|nr:subunit alpha of organic solute transporter [Chloropicon primus]UPR01359.1 subunit alpha of organic solute transporter [Chloropicon primus]|eukprot:QDZ22141.1 subunit alpha of organic solute transporter [Chloropicon primus]
MVNTVALVLGSICSVFACALAAYQIGMHLRYYNSPPFQRYIIRIIFMVPVYAICSVITLGNPKDAVYVSTIRDCYEAFILYNFHSLCLLYVGGPGEIETRAQGKVVEPSYMLMTCCFPPLEVDGKLLRQCKQATLQFVLAKPFLAATIFVLESEEKYSEGDFSPAKGYVYIVFVMNVCYAVALYGLIIFYLAAQDLLRPYNPVMKFVLIKGVIFFTFWQGFVLSLLTSIGVVESAEAATEIQNCLICVEMFAAAIGTLYAFPHKLYIVHDSKNLNVTNLGGKISHAISFTDVVTDTFHQFAPAYHDYTLYAESDSPSGVSKGKGGQTKSKSEVYGEGSDRKGKKKVYRMNTFVFKDLENVESQLKASAGRQRGDSILHRDSIADNALLMLEAFGQGEGGGGGNSSGGGGPPSPAVLPASIVEEEESAAAAAGGARDGEEREATKYDDDEEDNGRV